MSKLKTYVLSIVFAVVACTGCAADNNNGRTNVTTTTVTTREESVVTTQEVVTKSPSATTRKTPTITTTTVSTIETSGSLKKKPSKSITSSKESTTTQEKLPSISTVAEVSTSTTVQKTETSPKTTTDFSSTVTTTNPQPDTSTTTKETTAEEPVDPNKVILDVKGISLYPELPMGSSIVCATIALKYYGIHCSKMTLLKYSNIPTNLTTGNFGNPEKVFLGNPEISTICYGSSSVIETAINSYLVDQEITGYEVVNLKGTDFSDLYFEVYARNPVIIWVSSSMEDYSNDFMEIPLADGTTFTYNPFNSCVCLVGYDKETDSVFVCDPEDSENVMEYPKATVENIYDQMGKQALVIHKR